MKTRFNQRPDAATRLRAWNGPLTHELVQRPAEFGLGNIPVKTHPDATTTSICGYCATGCSLKVHLKDDQAVNLSAEPGYPVNLGMACPKGWESLAPLSTHDRATKPRIRDDEGKLVETSWDDALKTFVSRFKRIVKKHGSHANAWLSTGQIPSEEMAFLGALGKFGMGMLHGDGNTRQCMATAVTAYKESFGFDAPPYTYADFEESDVLVFVGSNLCITHPIMWQRVVRNKRQPEIIVIDPRRTETAMMATRHLALKPKSDLVLFYGIARLLIENDWLDHRFLDEHVESFDELKVFLLDGPYSLDMVAAQSGLDADSIFDLARLIGSGKPVSIWWTMGVNQSHEGTRVAQSLINLTLLTGNIGKPGTGANSITGQCNAMGSRLFSNSTNLLGGHQFTEPMHRLKVAQVLDIPVERIPERNSYAYDEIIDAIERGEIKGLWVIATNSAHSWMNQKRFLKVRNKLDCLVVQDMYHSTETAQIADIVLPAAGWGEKDGTFINSERRIGTIKKVSRAPGEALADFYIFQLIAHYWGCGHLFEKWSSPEAVFKLLAQLTAGQPCDISAVEDYRMVDAYGGIQWPLKSQENYRAERRLFEDGRFYRKNGKALLMFESPRDLPEPTDDDFPFTLLTGRGTSSQWHTQTRTGKSAVLRKLYPERVYVEINPADAEFLGIKPNANVLVASRRGELTAKAYVTGTVSRGQVFLPMHYPSVNQLTHNSVDPYSRQPSYKSCAVSVRPAMKG